MVLLGSGFRGKVNVIHGNRYKDADCEKLMEYANTLTASWFEIPEVCYELGNFIT